KGSFDGKSIAYTINANDQLLKSEDYRQIIVAFRNEAPIRLQDVANVIDGAENVNQAAWYNQTQAIILNIQRQPGANVIEVVD
ncbi:MAG TPA: efflux RND transporter permease subunit, partial [Candidatus Berkiella sp.]|nr:efflux RND transporter permease subunit [Candidatus Berkiella sp.]